MTHVLVVGGTGSIDRLVVARLLALGDTTRVLSRNPTERAEHSPRTSPRSSMSLPATSPMPPALHRPSTALMPW